MSDTTNNHLFDLINIKTTTLRQLYEESSKSIGEIKISSSEWVAIGFIYNAKQTVSSVARYMNITRQASSKLLKSLVNKGLVIVEEHPSSKREKLLAASPTGAKYYSEYLNVQNRLEKEISSNLGRDNLALLKSLLEQEWLPRPNV